MNLARNTKGKKMFFYRYIRNKINDRENTGLALVTKDTEKAEVFVASVFTSKTDLQQS